MAMSLGQLIVGALLNLLSPVTEWSLTSVVAS